PEQNFVGGAFVLGVVLEAVSLEVLHRIRLVVSWAGLRELFAQWVAVKRQAAVLLPVLPERSAKGMPRRGEVGAPRIVAVGGGSEGLVGLVPPGQVVPKEP